MAEQKRWKRMMNDKDGIIPFPDMGQIRDEAAAWVAQMDAREMTNAQRAELHAWMAQSPAHATALRQFADLWDCLDLLEELNSLEEPAQTPARAPGASWTRRRAVGAMAACVAGIVGAGAVYVAARRAPPLQDAVYETAKGVQRTVTLADGSTMILNTDSRAHVRYTKDGREVVLSRGEAHFDVEKDKSRAFTVAAGENVVRAVGTAFSVKVLDSTVEVVVAEGRVKMAPRLAEDHAAGALEAEEDAASVSIEMAAGDNARFNRGRLERLDSLSHAEIDRKLLWRKGMLSFEGEPLAEVILEVERYTDFVIELDDPGLKTVPIGGRFKVGDVDGLLNALAQMLHIEVEYVDEKHVRLSRSA